MLFILILISSIFSFSYGQTIHSKEMIVEKIIEESVSSMGDVYYINNKWLIIDWNRGEILLSDTKLRRKFGDVSSVKGSGRWENGIIIGYRDTADNPHVVLYDITKDSLVDITDQIPVGSTFSNIIEVILPESWNWAALLINSADGYLYYNNFNSFKKVATFQWVIGGERVFLFNDTILIGFGVSPPFYNNNYTIIAGYYMLGNNDYKANFFMEEPVYDDMIIGGDIVSNKILIVGNGDLYIFEIPSFTLVSKKNLINGNFISGDVIMLNESYGYVIFSSSELCKLYKFEYSRITLVDSLILDGRGVARFMRFDGNIYLTVFYYEDDLLRIFRIKDKVTSTKPEPEIPTKFMLYQNYPNPFNPSTTIEFDIPERTNVKLIIYDILGREVETLIDKELEPGKYKVNFNAKDLPSGVYFYTLKTPEFTKTNKMLLIK